MMIGITKELANDLAERGYSEADILETFGPKAHRGGELRVIYDRGNGDLTAPLPSSRHMYYIAKNWTAVALAADAPIVKPEPIELSAELSEHGRNDRVGVWKRGDDRLLSSCRNALTLLGKGWEFVGLADPERLRAVDEKKAVIPPARDGYAA
jgi:hypothetical protein